MKSRICKIFWALGIATQGYSLFVFSLNVLEPTLYSFSVIQADSASLPNRDQQCAVKGLGWHPTAQGMSPDSPSCPVLWMFLLWLRTPGFSCAVWPKLCPLFNQSCPPGFKFRSQLWLPSLITTNHNLWSCRIPPFCLTQALALSLLGIH